MIICNVTMVTIRCNRLYTGCGLATNSGLAADSGLAAYSGMGC